MMEFLEKAYLQARLSLDQEEVPIGAIIVKDGKVISEGHNEKEQRHRATSHAEINAIERASKALGNWRLTDCTLYTTLEPCPMCLAACQQARIKKLVYGAKDLKGGAISLGYNLHSDSRLNHQFEIQYVEFEKGSLILKEFFSKKR